MTEDELGKFREGERTSVRRGNANFGGMREENSECVSVRSIPGRERLRSAEA